MLGAFGIREETELTCMQRTKTAYICTQLRTLDRSSLRVASLMMLKGTFEMILCTGNCCLPDCCQVAAHPSPPPHPDPDLETVGVGAVCQHHQALGEAVALAWTLPPPQSPASRLTCDQRSNI